MDTKLTHRSDELVLRLATRQHGIVTRADALKLGSTPIMIHDRVKSGRLIRVYRGVYRIAGTKETPNQRVMAACLACGHGAAACRLTAAELWGLPGCVAREPEIRVPRGMRPRIPGITVHQMDLASRDCVRLDGIPVTSPTRTLVDIAASVSRDVLEEALDFALHDRLTTVARMQRRVAELSGTRGLATIRALVAARAGIAVPENQFETRLMRALEQHGLPIPIPQHPVDDEAGLIGRVDFAYPSERIAIEAQSRTYHSIVTDFEDDVERRARLAAIDWLTIEVTWHQLERDGVAIARRIARALTRRRGEHVATHIGG